MKKPGPQVDDWRKIQPIPEPPFRWWEVVLILAAALGAIALNVWGRH